MVLDMEQMTVTVKAFDEHCKLPMTVLPSGHVAMALCDGRARLPVVDSAALRRCELGAEAAIC